MRTGLHTVQDIHCAECATVVGWKYVSHSFTLPPLAYSFHSPNVIWSFDNDNDILTFLSCHEFFPLFLINLFLEPIIIDAISLWPMSKRNNTRKGASSWKERSSTTSRAHKGTGTGQGNRDQSHQPLTVCMCGRRRTHGTNPPLFFLSAIEHTSNDKIYLHKRITQQKSLSVPSFSLLFSFF